MTETFLKMGVDELSVSPGSVLPIREIIRKTKIGDGGFKNFRPLFVSLIPGSILLYDERKGGDSLCMNFTDDKG